MPPAGVPVYFPHGAPERITACHHRSRGFEPLSAKATCICWAPFQFRRCQDSAWNSWCCRPAPPLPAHFLFLSPASTVFPAASPNSTPRGLDKQNVNKKFVFIFPHRCTCTSGCAKWDNLHSIRCIVAARTTPPKPINRANEQSKLSLKPTISTSRGRISAAPRVNLTPARRDAETFFQKHLVIWSLCKESGGRNAQRKEGVFPGGLSMRLVSVAFTLRNASTSMSSSGISALGWLWKWICSWQRRPEHPWHARTLQRRR